MNQFLNITQDEFDSPVRAKVEEALSSKEEAEARAEAEEALKEAKEIFESLKAALEAKDVKIKEYEEALANIDAPEPTDAEIAVNERLVDLEDKLKKAEHRANVAEAALDTIAREETAANRISELKDAGVSLEDDAAEKQYSKIRDMDDDEFDAYKSELVALKSLYNSGSEETEEEIEVADLSSEEVRMIAQSLGCDPADSKCISLVNEVAQKVAEVSNSRRGPDTQVEKETVSEEKSETVIEEEKPKKETASKKETLSIGEAISRAVSQEIQAPASLREEIAQAWEGYYAEKRGENKSE